MKRRNARGGGKKLRFRADFVFLALSLFKRQVYTPNADLFSHIPLLTSSEANLPVKTRDDLLKKVSTKRHNFRKKFA